LTNQIDHRFRTVEGSLTHPLAGIGVSYMQGLTDRSHGKGLDNVVGNLAQAAPLRAYVDEDITLAAGLDEYTLVHLTGQGKFAMSPDDMTAIYNYLQNGGTVFIESTRSNTPSGDPPADAVFIDLINSYGIQLKDLGTGHELLHSPHLFGALPVGFETQGKQKLQEGGGVIYSTYDYGALWQGMRRSGPATREEIRAAHEFGINLVKYAHKRRVAAVKPK
jgi:hypothetical protein